MTTWSNNFPAVLPSTKRSPSQYYTCADKGPFKDLLSGDGLDYLLSPDGSLRIDKLLAKRLGIKRVALETRLRFSRDGGPSAPFKDLLLR